MAKNSKYAKSEKVEIKTRIPVAKPGIRHGDKTKYNRKPKYPKKVEE